jgi:hypothetical protein
MSSKRIYIKPFKKCKQNLTMQEMWQGLYKKNSKSEARNPKQIRMTKIQMTEEGKLQITNSKLQANSKLQCPKQED